MGFPLQVRTGAYVEFLVPKGGPEAPEGGEEYMNDSGNVRLWSHVEPLGTKTIAGVVHNRYCFWDDGNRRGKCARVCADAGWDHGCADFSRVNPREEIAWFRTRHAAAIKLLARYFGVRPRVAWGMVWFLEDTYVVDVEPPAAPRRRGR
jgi:hypothetical protein